jgi:hypothetical protein
MADPGAVNTTAKVSLKDQIAKRFATDRTEWETLVCNNKDQIGRSINEIDQWVRRIAECMAIKNGSTTIANSDQIGPDQFSHGDRTISDSFGFLEGGQLMNALGNNNDCLIHSFLTCVSPTFRTVVEEARMKIAGYFRRFILPTIQNLHNVKPEDVDTMRERLQSYHFLTGGEINILSSHYQVPIINIQDGDSPLERSMEIFPTQTDTTFWNSKNGAYDGPFYMIHGDDTHFTPVKYGGNYEIRRRRADLMKIASDITEERDNVFGEASTEAAKLDTVKEDFIYRIQPTVDSFKKEIVQTNSSITKSAKLAELLEILTPITKQYIDDIILHKLIDVTLKEKAYTIVHTALLQELSKKNNTSSATPNAPLNNISELEEYAVQAGLTDEDALLMAIKASQNESKGKPPANTVPGNPLQPPSRTRPETADGVILKNSENHLQSVERSIGQALLGSLTNHAINLTTSGKVLRTLSGITATVGKNSGKYTATVYEPVKSGGKRNTKKAMRIKKQKTKKLKRSK